MKKYLSQFIHSLLIRVLFFLLFLILFVGFLMHKLEPNVFPKLSDGIWWAFITLTTIGYGDFVPTLFVTRILAIVFIFIGIGYMSYLIFKLAEKTFSLQEKRREGKMKFVGKNHFIIVGWNERARGLIKSLKKKNKTKSYCSY